MVISSSALKLCRGNRTTMFIKCILASVLVLQVCWAFPHDLSPQITDGVDASPLEFPHQVSVQWTLLDESKFSHICGGSIISDRYVLTAGHCVMKLGKTRVVVGKYEMNKADESSNVILVDKKVVHSGYPGGVAQHDIALLRLKTPLVFSAAVKPVGLPKQGQMQTGQALLSGWGSISKGLVPKLPNVLQKANVPILTNDQCLKELKSQPTIGKQPELFDTQVCTGAAGGEISACSGDSGGPLVQKVGGNYVQVGIVSWGMMPCGTSHMPSVYTRVASYIDWIHANM